MHDTVRREGATYRVGIFHPASDIAWESRLRLVNAGEEAAEVSISGVDDHGEAGASAVSLIVLAGASRTLTAEELEGGEGLDGALGDGAGNWRLGVDSEQPLAVLNLLSSPDGHLANLSEPAHVLTYDFDFHRGEHGFAADFSDYPPEHEDDYELTSDYRLLPSPLASKSALYLSGDNHSADLFMFYKGLVAGLVPGSAYEVSVGAEIATEVPSGCVGVGGPPGESVWIKAGASDVEPVPERKGTDLRMNIDIGNQSQSGQRGVVLGDMANSRDCEQTSRWELKPLPAKAIPQPVTASPTGRAWLLFGIDSGFESRSEVYFTRATATFTPARTEDDGQ